MLNESKTMWGVTVERASYWYHFCCCSKHCSRGQNSPHLPLWDRNFSFEGDICKSSKADLQTVKKLILISYLKWMTEFLPMTKRQLALYEHNGSQTTFWWLLYLITMITYNGKWRLTCFFVQRTRQVQKNVYIASKTLLLCSVPLNIWKDGGVGEKIDKWKQSPAECITKAARNKKKII